MKQTKVIISILLIVLIVTGWGIKINSIINDTNKYNKNIITFVNNTQRRCYGV